MLGGKSQFNKWGQARLPTGSHTLLHLHINNARLGFPKHGGWRLHTVQTRAVTYSTTHTSQLRSRLLEYWWGSCYSQMTGWPCWTLCWRDAENSGCFLGASKKSGLKINIKKIKVLYQSNSTRTREDDIMVDGNKLNSVLEFTYLGNNISRNGCIDDEIQRRVTKARASFGWLRQRIWNNHHVSIRVKGKIHHTIVLSTLLYAEPKPGQYTDHRWNGCTPSRCDICVQSWG